VLLQAFRFKACNRGITYVKEEAVGIEMDGDRATVVLLKEGGRVTCGVVVNGAGAKAAEIVAMAKIELPVRPRRRTTFYNLCSTPLPRCPMVIESFGVAGLHFRPEGNGYRRHSAADSRGSRRDRS
jgi:sarcosine oxidase